MSSLIQRGMTVARIPLSIELVSCQEERSVAVRAVSLHSVAKSSSGVHTTPGQQLVSLRGTRVL